MLSAGLGDVSFSHSPTCACMQRTCSEPIPPQVQAVTETRPRGPSGRTAASRALQVGARSSILRIRKMAPPRPSQPKLRASPTKLPRALRPGRPPPRGPACSGDPAGPTPRASARPLEPHMVPAATSRSFLRLAAASGNREGGAGLPLPAAAPLPRAPAHSSRAAMGEACHHGDHRPRVVVGVASYHGDPAPAQGGGRGLLPWRPRIGVGG